MTEFLFLIMLKIEGEKSLKASSSGARTFPVLKEMGSDSRKGRVIN